jgi:hypothetical protein
MNAYLGVFKAMQILDIHFIEKIEPKTKFLGFFFVLSIFLPIFAPLLTIK